MPVRRGSLREDDAGSANGGVFSSQSSDTPDDVIVVDLREDEESLNWTKYGPDDSRERFSDWSDDKARKKLKETREKIRELRKSRD